MISKLVKLLALSAAALLCMGLSAMAQQRGTQSRPSAKESAPIDLTGYWVPVITEDWRWRMMTPPKGDYLGVPLNAEGEKLVNAWDPAKDEATGNQCKGYGAAAIMRLPLRLHITWQDDNTLQIETDAGQQKRLLRFTGTAPANQQPTLQGYSSAVWETKQARRGQSPEGNLKVVTTRLKSGYLRLNGVPHSDTAVLTEYFERHADYGTEWFTVIGIVEDPTYLTEPFIVSSHFKREPDGSKWDPTPCEVGRPAK